MKILMMIISLFIVVGCGNSEHPKPKNIDIRMERQYQSFKDQLSIRGIYNNRMDTVTIVLEDFDTDKYSGYCNYGDNLIKINSRNFDRWTEEFKELVLFHELGHCVLGLYHSYGIMNYNVADVYLYYLTDRDDMIEDMLGGL